MQSGSMNLLCAAVLFALLTGCGGGSTSESNLTQKGQIERAQASPIGPREIQATLGFNRSGKSVAITTASYQGEVQELYIAYFGRPADPGGLANFEAALLAADAPTDIVALAAAYASNPTIQNLVNSFGTSQESKNLYGSGDTTSFVTAIYQNVLGRTPQQSGLTFWVDAVDNNTLSKGNVALSIMAGALQNTTAQGLLDAQLVYNRVAVASYFSSQLICQNATGAYTDAAAANQARNLLDAVTAATNVTAYESSVAAAITSLEGSTSTSNLPYAGNYVDLDSEINDPNAPAIFSGTDTSSADYPDGFGSVTLGENGINGVLYPSDDIVIYPAQLTITSSAAPVYDSSLQAYIFASITATYGSLTCTGSGLLLLNSIELNGSTSNYFSAGVSGDSYPGESWSCNSSTDTIVIGLVPSVENANIPASHSRVASIVKRSRKSSLNSCSVSTANTYAYVTNADATISQYVFGAGGILTPLSPASIATASSPLSITTSPNGKYIYVQNYPDGTIWQYTISSNGTLVPMSPATIAPGNYPAPFIVDPDGENVLVGMPANPYAGFSVAYDPAGGFVYEVTSGANGSLPKISQFNIGPGAVLTPSSNNSITIGINSTEQMYLVNSVTVDPTGSFLYVSGQFQYGVVSSPGQHYTDQGMIWQYAIGPNGALTPLNPPNAGDGTNMEGVIFNPQGKYAYAAGAESSNGELIGIYAQFFTIGNTGELSPMSVPTINSYGGIAFSPSGQYAYMAAGGSNALVQFTVGPTGALSASGTPNVTTGNGPAAITFATP